MQMARSRYLCLSLASMLAGVALAEPVAQGARNAPLLAPAFEGQTRAPAMTSDGSLTIETLAEGLSHPWGMAFLPDGSLLVTERPGRLRLLGLDGHLSRPIGGVSAVHNVEQGGLLDVAVSPTFATDRMVYLTYAKPLGDGRSATAAARGVLSGDGATLEAVTDIFVQAPPSPTPMHYGARLLFGRDGTVFITTGEHSSLKERGQAQELSKSYGKVMRLAPDGTVPDGNPFADVAGAGPGVWTLGHRNIQGAALDPASGELWIVEHGPKGGDELNLAEPGRNFGWPLVSYGINYDGTPVGTGKTQAEGMTQPVYFWDPVIAPGGMAFYEGDLFADWRGDLLIASLTPGELVRLRLGAGDPPRVMGEERLVSDLGRVRDVEVAPDGAILLLTDRPDGAVLRLAPER